MKKAACIMFFRIKNVLIVFCATTAAFSSLTWARVSMNSVEDSQRKFCVNAIPLIETNRKLQVLNTQYVEQEHPQLQEECDYGNEQACNTMDEFQLAHYSEIYPLWLNLDQSLKELFESEIPFLKQVNVPEAIYGLSIADYKAEMADGDLFFQSRFADLRKSVGYGRLIKSSNYFQNLARNKNKPKVALLGADFAISPLLLLMEDLASVVELYCQPRQSP